MLYVYAITEAEASPAPLEGLRGHATHGIDDLPLRAIVSELGEANAEFTEDDMWGHEAVVEAVMEMGPVLPMRFGTALPDERSVRSLLAERRDDLIAGLERVRGAVELGVRAVVPEDDREPSRAFEKAAPTGAQYMRSLMDARHRGNALAQRIHEPLASLARESSI